MKRREQSVGAMNLGGVSLNKGINTVLKPVGLKRYAEGGVDLKAGAKILEKTAEVLEERNKLKEQKNMLLADGALKSYRVALSNSKSQAEFEKISSNIKDELKEFFVQSDGGKEFWDKHGENILALNQVDVENLRKSKEYDWGRDEFNLMLADNQGLLRLADGKKGEALLALGMDEIERSNFIDSVEKEKYKKGYLERGILNLALSDINGAKEQAVKYGKILGSDFKGEIDKLERIKNKEAEEMKAKKDDEDYLNNYKNAIELWQQRERGEISKGDFFVLSKEGDKGLLWGDESKEGEFALVEAYKKIRELNNGRELGVKEIADVGNNLIKAYRDKKVSLDEASMLQKQLIACRTDKNTRERMFDKEIDEFNDNVMGGDVFSNHRGDNIAMEEKAKVAFKVYDAYYAKKIALYQGFLGAGGVLNPNAKRRLDKQALDEVKSEFGYKENAGGGLKFSELKDVIKQNYNGYNEEDIWKRYYKEALYADDKKEVLRKIAQQQQKIELSYPSFDSWVELLESDLQVGDKFYFKGRLAEIG